MNLIYACVFHNENYIELLKILMLSVFIKGVIDKNTTKVLIVTSPSFKEKIVKALEEYDLPLAYFLLDLTTLFESGCARLNIFQYEDIDRYSKILYLDTDILINGDLNILLNKELSDDKIYALEEGQIGVESWSDFWGSQFFDFTKVDRRQTAFTSGILYFKNSDTIRGLFDTIKAHINDYVYVKKNEPPYCMDQPFIVYNAIMEKKFDNQMMKTYAENNPTQVSAEKIIYHFPGGPGWYDSKIVKMTTFWKTMNTLLVGRKYSWQNSSIQFLENGGMKAFGSGQYMQTHILRFDANFGGKAHTLTFNNEYTKFTSIRKNDNEVVKGERIG